MAKLDRTQVEFIHANYGEGNGYEFTIQGLADWYHVSVGTITQALHYDGAYREYATEEQYAKVKEEQAKKFEVRKRIQEEQAKRHKHNMQRLAVVEDYFKVLIDTEIEFNGTASSGTSTITLVALLEQCMLCDYLNWKEREPIKYAVIEEIIKDKCTLQYSKKVIRDYPDWISKPIPVIKRSGKCIYREKNTAIYCRWTLSEKCLSFLKGTLETKYGNIMPIVLANYDNFSNRLK